MDGSIGKPLVVDEIRWLIAMMLLYLHIHSQILLKTKIFDGSVGKPTLTNGVHLLIWMMSIVPTHPFANIIENKIFYYDGMILFFKK